MLAAFLRKNAADLPPLPWLWQSRWHVPVGVYTPKPVQEPALLWKEMIHGTTATPGPGPAEWLLPVWKQIVVMLTVMAGTSFFLYWRATPGWSAFIANLNGLVRVVTVILMGFWCMLTAFRAAGSISRERDRQTLESLLTLPGDRDEILLAKWLGSILRFRQFGYGLAVLWILGLAVGALNPCALVLLVAACGVHLAFFASFGVWLSVVSRNTLWANMCMTVVLMFLFMGSVLAWAGDEPIARATDAGLWVRIVNDLRINPGYVWWFSAFSWKDLSRVIFDEQRWLARAFFEGLASLPLFGIAAWWFWRVAQERFQDERAWQRH